MPDFSTSLTFTTGETVTAAIMNSFVPSITANASLIGGKPLVGTLGNNDSLFSLSAANNLQQILFASLQSQILANSVGASQSGVYNLLMNGDGLINQRPLSASIASTSYTELDRWKWFLVGTSAGRATVSQDVPTTLATLPFVTGGPTSYSDIKITVPSATSTIAAGDAQGFSQFIENSLVEPIANGPISISFIYKTNFSGVVSVYIRDFGAVHSYVVPVTLTGDSAWHLVTIQNITGLGAQTLQFGVYGGSSIDIGICLLSGSTFQTGTTGSWVAGNFLAANTQGNFFASAANVLQIAQFMAAPGATSVPYYSEPFHTLLPKCQRYYYKTYEYATKPAANLGKGYWQGVMRTTTVADFPQKFPVRLRSSTASIGGANPFAAGATVRDITASTNLTTGTAFQSDEGMYTITGLTASVAGDIVAWAFSADADY